MGLFQAEGSLRPLRGRQIPLIPAIAEAIKEGHRRIVVQAPTGFGKTVVAAHLLSRSAAKGKRPIFIAPAIALVEQTLHSFESQGIQDIGVIQAQHYRTDWKAQVQIASRDTLIRRTLPEVDFVLLDEAHDQREAMNAILDGEAWRNKIVIGLTATPWSRGMGLRWTKLIVAATVRDMIADGAPTGLSPFRIFAPSDAHEPNMAGVSTVAGDFQEAGAARVMSDDVLIGDAVETWLKHRQRGNHPGDRTFLYGVTRAHAKSLLEAFAAQGVRFGYIDGESEPEARLETFKRYRRKDDAGLCNVGVLITGVDEDVRCIVDCAPTKSEIRHVQKIGRGLRLADGKTELLILDHAGNTQRLGMVTDIHHDELDTRGPKDKDAPKDEKIVPKPRKCGKCFAMIPPGVRACPACGDVYQAPNRVEHLPGELVEMSSSTKAKKPPKPKKDKKQTFYSGLLGIARQRGFNEKWAAHKYRAKFGVWPKGLVDVPSRPTAAVIHFEREQYAAYKASKREAQPA